MLGLKNGPLSFTLCPQGARVQGELHSVHGDRDDHDQTMIMQPAPGKHHNQEQEKTVGRPALLYLLVYYVPLLLLAKRKKKYQGLFALIESRLRAPIPDPTDAGKAPKGSTVFLETSPDMTSIILSALALSFFFFAAAQSGTAALASTAVPAPEFAPYPPMPLSSGAVTAIVICSIALVALVVLASLYCCCRNRAASFRLRQGEPTAAQFKDLESQMQELQAQVAILQAGWNIDHADVKATKMEKERMLKVGVNRDRNSGMIYTGDEDAQSVATKLNPPRYDA
ncbi:hypothetical protein C8J57DRAFT_1611911 [Mycena rebaudengoi]|nr:hypothetical protein C8J57DRAFT_1611911 [Mycena rebaudengoi]